MSSDSSPSSPAPLTPESTGSAEPDSTDPKWRKQRRQVAFYPNLNATNKPLKPFSRSAAKRESVMTLGSIEHLQHYFTKTGLQADKQSLAGSTKGLVSALGGLPEISLHNAPKFDLPPSPAVPTPAKPAFDSYSKPIETDSQNLRPSMIEDLDSVTNVWRLNEDGTLQDLDRLGVTQGENFDVLSAIKTTTRAIRSVRNYVLSMPSENTNTNRSHFRPQTLSSSPIPKRHSATLSSTTISLGKIRKAALNVLAVLRELEETSRLPLSDDAYDAQSDHGGSQGSHSRVASPSNLSDEPDYNHSHLSSESEPPAFTLVRVRGRYDSVPVWEELEDEFNQTPEVEVQKKEGWEERLVLGSGWLYKQGIRLESLAKERLEIKSYLDVADEVLFNGPKEGRRGWAKERDRSRAKGRRVSAGDVENRGVSPDPSRFGRRVASTDGILDTIISEEPEEMNVIIEEDVVDDEDLPVWAKRSTFEGDTLGRAHATLVALLPATLLQILSMDSSDRKDFLHRLSSGQALCVAYNTGVRQSRKPWGYISKDAIHDILALEAASPTAAEQKATPGGWTFRRSDNLRLWIAALKLRYLIPITGPENRLISGTNTPSSTPQSSPMPLPSPMKTRFHSDDPPVFFDAPLVARQENGWEDMLEAVLFRWVDAIVGELRGERSVVQ